MKKIVVMLSVLFMVSASWAEDTPDVIGKAYSFDGKQELYQEQHYYSKDGESHQVLYLSVDGKQFAKKDISYKKGKSTPSFRQEDTRYPEIIEVKWMGEQLSISYFAKDEGKEKKKVLDVESPLVIDAGFDGFIRENWSTLTESGNRLKFSFPAPSRQMLVSLVVENKTCSYPTEADKCFMVNAANWFVKMLVDPIELGYDKNSQRLKRFRGLANIQDKNGEGLKVDIQYTYPQGCSDNSQLNCVNAKEENDNVFFGQDTDLAATISLTFTNDTSDSENLRSPITYQW